MSVDRARLIADLKEIAPLCWNMQPVWKRLNKVRKAVRDTV
jgi:hypothetical protein